MSRVVAVVLLASAAFVFWTSGQLPEQVASHFGVSGRADAFLPRAAFTSIMLLAVVGVPFLVWALQVRAARSKRSNIPNREHWFSAQHDARTVRFLERHAGWFTIVMVAFMTAVHWLVVQANTTSAGPAQLNNTGFITALVTFFAFVVSWIVVLHLRFRKKR